MLAERPSIPARIVNLTDSAALELQIIENLHRTDVHEWDEAFGYRAPADFEAAAPAWEASAKTAAPRLSFFQR